MGEIGVFILNNSFFFKFFILILLSILPEVFIFLSFFKKKKFFLTFFISNALSSPMIYLLIKETLFITPDYFPQSSLLRIILFGVLVLVIETIVIKLMKKGIRLLKIFLYSLIANLISIVIGYFLSTLFFPLLY